MDELMRMHTHGCVFAQKICIFCFQFEMGTKRLMNSSQKATIWQVANRCHASGAGFIWLCAEQMFFTVSTPIGWGNIQVKTVSRQKKTNKQNSQEHRYPPCWKAPPPFYIFPAEIGGRLALTSVSTSSVSSLRSAPPAPTTTPRMPLPFTRPVTTPPSSDQWKLMAFISMASPWWWIVSLIIVSPGWQIVSLIRIFLFFFFAMPEPRVQKSKCYTLVISQLIHVRANTHTQVGVAVERPRRAGEQPNQQSDSIVAVGLIKLSPFRSGQTHPRRASTVRC